MAVYEIVLARIGNPIVDQIVVRYLLDFHVREMPVAIYRSAGKQRLFLRMAEHGRIVRSAIDPAIDPNDSIEKIVGIGNRHSVTNFMTDEPSYAERHGLNVPIFADLGAAY